MRTTLFFLLSISAVLYSAKSDSLHLRIFPGMEKYKISTIEVVNRDFALAAGEEVLLKWDEKYWTEFKPGIPPKEFYSIKVKAFSPKNIWLFYRKHPNIFHTEILHFDGKKWKQISSPQAYQIYTVSFIDSTRFFAGGWWGSMIYYDGDKTINIKTPRNVEILHLFAFSEDHLYAIIRIDEYGQRSILYQFAKREWQILNHIDQNIVFAHFYSPDSGLFITDNSEVFDYRSGEFILKYSFPNTIRLSENITTHKDSLYFWSGNVVYHYHQFGIDSISKVEFPVKAYYLSKSEFFLIDSDHDLYYWGDRNYGQMVRPMDSNFKLHKFVGHGLSGHLGVSLYPNSEDGIDIYFTNPENVNEFYNYKKYFDRYKNVYVERGLIGFSKSMMEGQPSWDAGVFFADIDNDGDMDAVVASLMGNSLLYENIGNDVFNDVTDQYGFSLQGRINTIYWADINNDGNLDFSAGDETGPMKILMGNGFFKFEDVTAQVGIPDNLQGYMPAFVDIDGDGDMDLILYSIFDRMYCFENQGVSPTTNLPLFIDVSDRSPELTSDFDFFTQSVAFGDYDNDGDFDLFLANRRSPLRLFENDGKGVFKDVSLKTGFGQKFLAYGGIWGDINQDGYLDLFLTTLGKNYIFWNWEGHFFDIDSTSLPDNGLSYSTGSALADLDGDGDLDIVVANSEIGVSHIYENLLNENHTLKIAVRRSAENRFGIGAQVFVYEAGHLGDRNHFHGIRQIHTNQGYLSSGLPIATFGLSPQRQYDVQVKFSTGEEVNIQNISVPNAMSVAQPASVTTRSKGALRFAKSFFYHPGRRPVTLKFIGFVLIILIFNIYLFTRSSWGMEQILFFNILIISVLAIVYYLFPNRSLPLLSTVVYGILVALSFAVIERYLKLKRSDTNPYQLYDLLRQFKHGETGMGQLDRLRFCANNLMNAKIKEDFIEQSNVEVISFLKYTAPLLKQIKLSVMKVNLPNSMIHGIKATSNFVIKKSYLLNSNDKKPKKKLLPKYSDAISSLKKELNSLRSEVEKLVSCSLLETISDGLNQFARFTEVSVTKPEFMNDLQVVIAREDLIQVLSNLFQNSLDAMRDNKVKKISISVGEVVNNSVVFKIKDAGSGIPEQIQQRIFEENFSTQNQTGLGLPHAQKLLWRYGGDIHLINSPSVRGACFEIKLMVLKHDNRQE